MKTNLWIAALVISSAVLSGCKKEEAPAPPAQPVTPPQAKNEQPAPAKTETPSSSLIPGVDLPKVEVPKIDQAKVDEMKTQVSSAVGEGSQQVQALMKQAAEYIDQKKFELADKTIDQLEGMKASLGEAVNKQVEGLRARLNAAMASNAPSTRPAVPDFSK